MGWTLWNGAYANSLGGYIEYDGFDQLINTGKFDVGTHVACDALDSYLANYGNAVVGVAGAPNIVNSVAGLIRSIRYRIMTAGLDEDSAVTDLVMHPRHWDIIANVWFCDYGIVCANTGITNESMILDIAARRDQLLASRQLPIDGKMYQVYLDNQISNIAAPYTNTTKYCGDIYAITKSVEGETVTWGEYQNFDQTCAPELAWWRQNFGNVPISITDGGRFMWAPTTEGAFCFDARVLVKPRIIMRMPWTSGRLLNVCTVPIGDYADVTGSGGQYELDGGIYGKPYMGLYGDELPGVGGEVEWME